MADAGIVTAPLLNSISQTSLLAANGATLDFSTAASFHGGSGFSHQLRAEGGNSVIDLSGLTTFTGTTGSQGHTTFYTGISAFSGGRVDLGNVTSVHNQAYLQANGMDGSGAASTIDLANLTQFAGGARGQIVSVADAGIITAPMLNSISQTSLLAANGATLDFSTAVAFDGGNGFTYRIRADGDNSLINLSGVTSFAGTTGSQGHTTFFTEVEALNGGLVDLQNVTTANNQVRFNASGDNGAGIPSRLDLRALSSLTGESSKSLSVSAAGVIDLSAINSLNGTSLSATNAGQLDLSNLADYHGSSTVNNSPSCRQ